MKYDSDFENIIKAIVAGQTLDFKRFKMFKLNVYDLLFIAVRVNRELWSIGENHASASITGFGKRFDFSKQMKNLVKLARTNPDLDLNVLLRICTFDYHKRVPVCSCNSQAINALREELASSLDLIENYSMNQLREKYKNV
jgi:hypothetical protein